MCCTTHPERDIIQRPADIDSEEGQEYLALFTDDKRFRCQCKFGMACVRKMTQEDFLCDWCRVRKDDADGSALPGQGGHQRWCGQNVGNAGGNIRYDTIYGSPIPPWTGT